MVRSRLRFFPDVVIVLVSQSCLLLALLEELHPFGIHVFDILSTVVIANDDCYIFHFDPIGFALFEFFLVNRAESLIDYFDFDIGLCVNSLLLPLLAILAKIVVFFG